MRKWRMRSYARAIRSGFGTDVVAVVLRTVHSGAEPILEVVHAPDGAWLIGNGVDYPEDVGGYVAVHVRHLADRDNTIDELSALPLGFRAYRQRPGEKWLTEPFQYADE